MNSCRFLPILVVVLLLAGQGGLLAGSVETVFSHRPIGAFFLDLGEPYQQLITALNHPESPELEAITGQLENLLAIARANLQEARANAQLSECQMQQRTVRTALDMLRLDQTNATTDPEQDLDLDLLVRSGHLSQRPVCPAGGVYEGDGTARKGVRCTVHGTLEHPNNLPSPKEDAAWPDLAAVLSGIRWFHEAALFQPRGGLWVTVSGEPAVHLLLEAACRPKALFDYLGGLNLPSLPRPVRESADQLEFTLPIDPMQQKKGTLLLSDTGIFFTSGTASASHLPAAWSDFRRLLADGSGIALAIEIQPAQLGNGWVDTYGSNWSAEVQKALPKLDSVRLSLGRRACSLTLKVAEGPAREVLKAELERWHGIFVPVGDKLLYDRMMQVPEDSRPPFLKFREWLKATRVTVTGEWAGIEGGGLPGNAVIVPAVAGMLAAIAIPNFQRAREKAIESHCRSNLRLLSQAMKLYETDEGMPMKFLDQQLLARKKLIQREVACPKGGNYSLGHSTDGLPSVCCSLHGSVDH